MIRCWRCIFLSTFFFVFMKLGMIRVPSFLAFYPVFFPILLRTLWCSSILFIAIKDNASIFLFRITVLCEHVLRSTYFGSDLLVWICFDLFWIRSFPLCVVFLRSPFRASLSCSVEFATNTRSVEPLQPRWLSPICYTFPIWDIVLAVSMCFFVPVILVNDSYICKMWCRSCLGPIFRILMSSPRICLNF